MPLFKNKTKSGRVSVYRPDGLRYAEHFESLTMMKSEAFRRQAAAICVEMATTRVLGAFYREFGEYPKDDIYTLDVMVLRTGVRVTLYEAPSTVRPYVPDSEFVDVRQSQPEARG
jgi:hypothetical protein